MTLENIVKKPDPVQHCSIRLNLSEIKHQKILRGNRSEWLFNATRSRSTTGSRPPRRSCNQTRTTPQPAHSRLPEPQDVRSQGLFHHPLPLRNRDLWPQSVPGPYGSWEGFP